MKIALGSFYFIIAIIIVWSTLHCIASVSVAQADTSTGVIMGRATMPDESTGIGGCEVQVLGKGDFMEAKTTTDPEGNFIFTNLQPNDDTWGYRLVVKNGNWGQSVTQQFSVVANSTTIVAVRVYPYIGGFSFTGDRQSLVADGSATANLTVSLYDMNGNPVPDGVHVHFTQSSYYSNPGRFFAGDANGTDITLATKGGRINVRYGAVPGDTVSRGVRIDAACVEPTGEKSLNLTFNLSNPNAIEGVVYDATGRPVPFARVFLERWDGVSKYAGYSSAETGNRSDGSGTCDADGFYRFAVMPAGGYRVTAGESTYSASSTATVVRGKYTLDITIPMGHGAIQGWVKDSRGNVVPGANVTLLRVYDKTLVPMASNTSAGDGSFSFEDVWYGKYDVQAVYAGQTADVPLILDVNRTSVTLPFLINASDITPTPAPTKAPASGTATGKPSGNTTVTPRPPTPTPPPVTPSYLISSYGMALVFMIIICAAALFIMLRFSRK